MIMPPGKSDSRITHNLDLSDIRIDELLDLLFEGAFLHESGTIIHANRCALDLFGYKLSEIVETPVFNYIARESHDLVKNRITVLTEEPTEIFCVKKNGDRFPAEVRSKTSFISGKNYRIVSIRNLTEQKQTESELYASRERFKVLFENAPDAYFIYDLKGTLIDGNAAAERLTGYQREDLIGKELLRSGLVPRIELSRAARLIAQSNRGEPVSPAEMTITRKDGKKVNVEVQSVSTTLLGSKRVVLAIARDISAGKQAAEALIESEQKYRSLTENLRVGVYRSTPGPHGEFIEVNPAMVTLFGYKNRQEMLQIRVSEIYKDPADRTSFDKELQVRGQITQIEQILKRKNGSTFNGLDTAVAVKDEGGEILHYDGIIEDITKRKIVETALQQSESTLRTLFETMVEGVIWIAPDHRILKANLAARRLLRLKPPVEDNSGYLIPPREVIRIDGTHLPIDEQPWFQAITQQCPVRNVVVGLKYPDGELCWIEVGISPLIMENGDFQGGVGILTDITERKGLEEQFLQSQKMEAVGRLASGIAHDINNVLTVILGNLELMEMDTPQDAPSRKRIPDIEKAAQQAQALSQKLLVFARKGIIQPQVFDINTSINTLVDMLCTTIGEDIELNVELGSDPIHVFMDPGHFQQILMNLVVNARDAMPGGGILTINASTVRIDATSTKDGLDIQPGEHICLSISDRGCGMSEEVMSHIFEPFYTTKEETGSGLGLSTVFGIIEQNNGAIKVRSTVDKGTIFEIYFPLSREQPAAAVETPKMSELPRGEGTIILVEDDEMVRQLALKILTDAGYTVHSFDNGQDAFQFITDCETPINLLLTDIVMPKMSGVELANGIKTGHPEIQILLMSGYSPGEMMQRGTVDAQGPEILTKPFTPSHLLNKVGELTGQSRHET